MPAFFKVVPRTEIKPGHKQRAIIAPGNASPTGIGDADMSIPPGDPVNHPAESLRTARASL